MDKDLPRQLYEKYYSFIEPRITVMLKNGHRLHGLFAGFFHGEEAWGEPYVTRWHFTADKSNAGLGTDAFGYSTGRYIDQEAIAQVFFHNDNSTLIF